jgi:arylsulfate sulfotransferase
MKNRRIICGRLAFLLGASAAQLSTINAQAGLSASLSTSVPSPATVGTLVAWTATATGSQSGNVWYRFRVRELGTAMSGCRAGGVFVASNCADSSFSMIQDYGPVNTINWTASEHEGNYEIEASARDNDTGAVSAVRAVFQFTPLVADNSPVISPTANPLVFLYSAPPCPIGATMQVQFQGPDGSVQSTNAKPCDGRRTMNFYLAGMLMNTAYSAQYVVNNGADPMSGPVLPLATEATTFSFAARTLAVPPPTPFPNPVILQSRFGNPAATDPMGNLLWYSLQSVSMISRPEPGGLFLGWYEDATVDTAHQILEEFDLAGTVLRQTNAARVNEQLAAMGMHSINSFHHDIRRLPTGGLLALAATERILTDVQGPGPVDVLGDIILVLDRNLQVQWAWDTFDHLDTSRLATLGETCAAINGGCPPVLLAPQANDWTHGNALQLTPDGNILYSTRTQDWVIKIDYENGKGTGNILWRLGKDGDFQFISNDPYPWFSHQHDSNIDANGILTVFDNGNVRQASDPTAHSRGQVLQIDEVNMTATLLVNADLGDFSTALGSAQALPNGNYHFHLGFIVPSNTTRVVEVAPSVAPSGAIVYDMHIGEIEYRSFRMRDLYTPPDVAYPWENP